MYINKIMCMQCHGKGYMIMWRAQAPNADGTRIINAEEATCGNCSGTGFNRYPVFTVDEAIKVAKHFGFDIIEEEIEEE